MPNACYEIQPESPAGAPTIRIEIVLPTSAPTTGQLQDPLTGVVLIEGSPIKVSAEVYQLQTMEGTVGLTVGLDPRAL